MNLPIQKYGKTERRKFGKINEVIEIPDLVEIQKESYESFVKEGIGDIFEDFSPITSNSISSITRSGTSRSMTRRSAATATRLMRFPLK